jgi:hypothetical protein
LYQHSSDFPTASTRILHLVSNLLERKPFIISFVVPEFAICANSESHKPSDSVCFTSELTFDLLTGDGTLRSDVVANIFCEARDLFKRSSRADRGIKCQKEQDGGS